MTVSVNSDSVDDAKSQQLDAISTRLVAARASAQALPDFPGQVPESLSDAYAVQSASIERWPDEITGWKVGMVAKNYRSQHGAERLAGPIFKSSIVTIEPGARKSMPIFNGGFAAVEAEFVFELGTTIEPTGQDFSDQELVDRVSALHVGAEIASSPMAMVNDLGPCSIVSDFGNNAGLLVGPSVPDWSGLSPDDLTAEVTIDDVTVGTATASAIQGGLLQALRFLFDSCADRGIVLAKGTLVSTGAVTGIHEVTESSNARVDFGSYGSFEVTFESMQARQ